MNETSQDRHTENGAAKRRILRPQSPENALLQGALVGASFDLSI